MYKSQRSSHNLGVERVLDAYGVPIERKGGTIVGKLGSWRITKAGPTSLWVAETTPQGEGLGLPLEVATKLHERKYGDTNLGTVIRVSGYAKGIHPRLKALPKLPSFYINGASLNEIRDEAVEAGEPLFVDKYHIDNNHALAPFVAAVRSVLNGDGNYLTD